MTACPQSDWLSPSLQAAPDGSIAAYELKFLVPDETAREVEAWAASHLARDPHADPARGGAYRVTSVYFDTPGFDVLKKAAGFDEHKYRVRRYGAEPTVHLEKKSKSGGRVWKVRAAVPMARLAAGWPDGWFADEIKGRGLAPVCRVGYDRCAFIGRGPHGGLRLTLDRGVEGLPVSDPLPHAVADAAPLLPGQVVVEFKFPVSLPALFKEAIEGLRLTPAGVSKYRRCAAASGLGPEARADG